MIEQQKQQAAEEIDKADGRYHALADVGNAFYAAQDHGAGEECEDDSHQMGRQVKSGLGSLSDGVGLCGTADAEGGDQGTDGVDTAQMFVM